MNTVGSVVISKVFASYARQNYAAVLEVEAPRKLEDVIDGLEKHFASMGVELVQCDQCGGYSPETGFDSCPFCNDGKKETAPAPSMPTIVEAATEAPVQRKKVSTPDVVLVKASAPTMLAGISASAVSETDLDQAIAEYQSIARDTAEGIYRLGVVIRRMRDHLWQQRTENGKPKYKSFEQFVESELGISRTQANRHRRIVETFTRDQIMENPPGVLKALIAAPKEAHEDLLSMHRGGASIAKIEKRVKEIRDEKGITVIETDAMKEAFANGKNVPSAATTAAAAKARKKETAAITLGLKAEAGTVKLLAKPKKRGEAERRARTVEDQPFGKIETINGVALYLALKQTPAGELEIRYTAKRDEE